MKHTNQLDPRIHLLIAQLVVVWGMHGIYGAGKTMDETFGLIETVEKAAQIYMLTAHMPRINTIKDSEMQELAEFFGVKYRKDFLNL